MMLMIIQAAHERATTLTQNNVLLISNSKA